MIYDARIENTTTKTYGKIVQIDAESEGEARMKAQVIALDGIPEDVEANWDLWEDCDWTWRVTSVEPSEDTE